MLSPDFTDDRRRLPEAVSGERPEEVDERHRAETEG
jgi:hypothetical protein